MNETTAVFDKTNAAMKDCSILDSKDGERKDASSELGDSKNNTVDDFLEEEPPTLSHNQTCMEHADEPVLAYNKLTYQYLCGRCVSSQKLQKEHYQVYPSVVNRAIERIESAKKMIKFRRTQLE